MAILIFIGALATIVIFSVMAGALCVSAGMDAEKRKQGIVTEKNKTDTMTIAWIISTFIAALSFAI